jgi:rubrerythrin
MSKPLFPYKRINPQDPRCRMVLATEFARLKEPNRRKEIAVRSGICRKCGEKTMGFTLAGLSDQVCPICEEVTQHLFGNIV